MDVKAIPALIVGVMVAVVMVGAVLPVFAETTQAYDTFTNDGGYYRMVEYSDSDTDEYTLNWIKTATTHLEINGVDYDAYGAYGSAVTTIVASDSWVLRYDSENTSNGYLQYYDGTNWYGNNTNKAMSFQASGGTATLTGTNADDTTTVKNLAYTKLYVIMPTATEDIMKKPTETPYVKGDSGLYAMGITGNKLVQISGNINDGVNIDLIGVADETITDVVIEKTEINNYVNLYQISKITFNATVSGTTTAYTYNFFIVPYEVTAEKAVHPDATLTILINVLPLIAVAGLLLAGVAWFVWKKG